MRQIPCDVCRCLVDADLLVDGSSLLPVASDHLCVDCEHVLRLEQELDDPCAPGACSACDGARRDAARDRQRREDQARALGGLSAVGRELLGWGGGDMPEKPKPTTRDVLEIEAVSQLERIEETLAAYREGPQGIAYALATLYAIAIAVERANDAVRAMRVARVSAEGSAP